MTVEQVKNNMIQNLAENAYVNMCTVEEMNIIIECLKKQIPKPPTVPDEKQEPCSCPRCEYGHIIGNKYCPNCGQRIDWSGEE